MNTKNLPYYKTLNYRILIEPVEEEKEVCFIAYTKELGKFSCYGQGVTEIEAITNFYEEKDNFLELLFSQGKTIPEPESNLQPFDNYSGIFNIRTSKTIHYKLANQAKELGLSMNLYLNQILSDAVSIEEVESKVSIKLDELSSKMDFHYSELCQRIQYKWIGTEHMVFSEDEDPYVYKLAG